MVPILVGLAGLTGGWILYRWIRPVSVNDTSLDISSSSHPPALLGHTVRDDHILVLLDIARTNDLYARWNAESMTEAEQDLLSACLAEIVEVFERAKSYENGNSLIKRVRSHPGLHPAVKVAALMAGTWNPTDGSAPVLSEAEQYQHCFRIAACVYFHKDVQANGFAAVCKANAGIVSAIVQPGDSVFN